MKKECSGDDLVCMCVANVFTVRISFLKMNTQNQSGGQHLRKKNEGRQQTNEKKLDDTCDNFNSINDKDDDDGGDDDCSDENDGVGDAIVTRRWQQMNGRQVWLLVSVGFCFDRSIQLI